MALTPPVWRHREPRALVLAAFAAATTLGGMTTALGLWLLSGLAAPLPLGVHVGLFLGLSLLLVAKAGGWVEVPLPQAARQIPRTVFDRAPAQAAARFGYPLGTGVRTYLSSTAPYIAAAWLLLLPPPLWGALLLGAAFGAARGVLPALTLRPDRAARLTVAAPAAIALVLLATAAAS